MGSLFTPVPAPKSKLGVYRQLSTLAGVHVSPLCLGAMSIGDQWHKYYAIGATGKDQSTALLDKYFELGGNFIDTANNYQDETSEIFIGEWAESRGIRDQLFIATKYTQAFRKHDPSIAQNVLYTGNGAKSLKLSFEASLKKLRTTYVDLLYVHFWDFTTTVEEVMNSLHALVLKGQVLYLGISDTPAWIVAQANQYARDHGLTPFSVYQGKWSILDRSFEREIIPMARQWGMALAPWGVMGSGKIRTDAEEERRRQSGANGRLSRDGSGWERNEAEKKVCQALEKVAAEIGAKSITAVAIAYVMHKTRFVFPILGGHKIEQLLDNLEALDLALTQEHLDFLDGSTSFELGFPLDFIGDGTSRAIWLRAYARTAEWPLPKPISGSREEVQ